MPTEMELTLEQTQQGVSYEVSNIRVILFTVKMEILLEPTSNKLMVDPYGFEGIYKNGHGVLGSYIKDYLYSTESEILWVISTFVVIEGEIDILHDVVGTVGYHYEVLQSFPVERIEQGNK
ncbi:hypothetical protein Tco_0615974 [Tanacetum coccineum]